MTAKGEVGVRHGKDSTNSDERQREMRKKAPLPKRKDTPPSMGAAEQTGGSKGRGRFEKWGPHTLHARLEEGNRVTWLSSVSWNLEATLPEIQPPPKALRESSAGLWGPPQPAIPTPLQEPAFRVDCPLPLPHRQHEMGT